MTLDEIQAWVTEVRLDDKVDEAYAIIRDLIARCERARWMVISEPYNRARIINALYGESDEKG